jgi:tetratricopeptide (TPR) repeat protein
MQFLQHHARVGRRACILTTCLLSILASAQVAQRTGQNPITRQQAAQQAAIAAGDTDRVAQASQILIATCLREFAGLRLLAGDNAEAIAIERQALELDNSNIGRLDLARLLATAGKLAEAEQLVDAVLVSNPNDLVARRLQSSLNRLSVRPAPPVSETPANRKREGHLRRILAVAYNDWGTTQAKNGDYHGARGLFSEGEHWDPTAPGLMRNLGMAAFQLGDYARSASAFTAALEGEGGQSSVEREKIEVLLGLSQFLQKQYDPAAKAFGSAPDATFSDAHATYAWAFSLAHLNNPQQASSVLARLVTMPISPSERALACQVYDQIEAYEESVSCFKRVLQEDSNIARAHFELGAALIHLGLPAKAIPELRTEVASGDTQPEVAYYLAYALNETQGKEEAEQILRTVVEKQPNYTEAQYLLGKILLEKGDTKESIRHLEQAALMAPDEPFIHYQLQLAYKRDGREADATREMQIYSELKAKARSAPASR